VTPRELADQVRTRRHLVIERPRMSPLFADQPARERFEARHARTAVPRADLAQAVGPCFLGIDAGSTTIKAVLISEAG
jgi:activator of 2-hydroxyglutaryl-CoA dehydratase